MQCTTNQRETRDQRIFCYIFVYSWKSAPGRRETYNAGSRNIEELFEELVELSKSLNDEEQRHVRENISEEELVFFDILTRPAPELTTEERAEVKKVARELLAKLKEITGTSLTGRASRTPWTPGCPAPTRPSYIARSARRCSNMCMRPIRSGIKECMCSS